MSELPERVAELEGEVACLRCALDAHRTVKAANRALIDDLKADVERLRRYEPRGKAYLAYAKADTARLAHWQHPPHARPASPEQMMWDGQRSRLGHAYSLALSALHDAQAALVAAEQKGADHGH